jgi:5-formyltetrahydrofolate cyclo-ligase
MQIGKFVFMQNSAIQKQQLRKEIRSLKASLTDVDKRTAADVVMQELLSDSRLRECTNIVLFWSMPDEISTLAIVDKLNESHDVYLPVIVGDDLQFRLYEGLESMSAEGQYGIFEPTSAVSLQSGAPQTAIVVPGMAFTQSGCRMGRGRGYYDRILSRFPDAYKIGICYKCQIVSSLPVERHDIMMDRVVCG